MMPAGAQVPPSAEDIAEAKAWLAGMERGEFIASVNDQLRLYMGTGNGLAIWRAYRICREANEPIPDVILRWFDRAGAALERADSQFGLAKAVRMAGFRGSARRHLLKTDRTFDVVSAVHQLMAMPGRRFTKNAACRRVATRYRMKPDAVERMYERWSKLSDDPKPKPVSSNAFDWATFCGSGAKTR